jgi:small subunit ribosomal protein S15
MALQKEEKSKLVKEYGKDEKDTGNVKVQIAILTERINDLNKHLLENKHDYCSKRSLFVLVGQRAGLIQYYDKVDHEGCVELTKKLNVRIKN